MEEAVLNYLSSMSCLSKKIFLECQDIQNRFCDKWHNLSVEQQEQIIDEHYIGPQLASKYKATSTKLYPDCFPVLKVASGEKIVVDFEHDENGWTWKDEHSGPFSWRTKSQQDLTLEDFEVQEEIQPVKKRNPSKVSSFKNPSGLENVNDSKNEVEEMFKKFGLRKSKDEEEVTDKDNFCPENFGFEGDEVELQASPSVVIKSESSNMENEKSQLLEGKTRKTKSKSSSKKKSSRLPLKKDHHYHQETSAVQPSNVSKAEEAKNLGSYNEVFLNSSDNIVTSLEDYLSRPLEPLNDVHTPETNISLKKTGLDLLDNW